MKTIQELLPGVPFFDGLTADELALLAGCATNVHLRPGQYLFREGDPADSFFVVRHGRISIEMHTPTAQVVLDSAHEGEVVGWSWIVPPYRWTFDARATEETSGVSFDATCLRSKFDSDPRLGFDLMQRVVRVMSNRIHSARVRLLDLYGGGTP